MCIGTHCDAMNKVVYNGLLNRCMSIEATRILREILRVAPALRQEDVAFVP
jgi:hypothetical protein